jgi:hypothetical protein
MQRADEDREMHERNVFDHFPDSVLPQLFGCLLQLPEAVCAGMQLMVLPIAVRILHEGDAAPVHQRLPDQHAVG